MISIDTNKPIEPVEVKRKIMPLTKVPSEGSKTRGSLSNRHVTLVDKNLLVYEGNPNYAEDFLDICQNTLKLHGCYRLH